MKASLFFAKKESVKGLAEETTKAVVDDLLEGAAINGIKNEDGLSSVRSYRFLSHPGLLDICYAKTYCESLGYIDVVVMRTAPPIPTESTILTLTFKVPE